MPSLFIWLKSANSAEASKARTPHNHQIPGPDTPPPPRQSLDLVAWYWFASMLHLLNCTKYMLGLDPIVFCIAGPPTVYSYMFNTFNLLTPQLLLGNVWLEGCVAHSEDITRPMVNRCALSVCTSNLSKTMNYLSQVFSMNAFLTDQLILFT